MSGRHTTNKQKKIMKFRQHIIPDIMDQIHRKRIDDLIEIVPCYLIQTGIFNQDDCNIPTWSRNLNNPDTIKDIFSTIKTRGPDAYKNLILSLRLSDHIVIADMLDIID